MAENDAIAPVIPDEIGYVYGWRAWRWDATTQCLRPYINFPHMDSPVRGEKVADAWVGKQARAQCAITHAVMISKPRAIDLAGWDYHPLIPDPRCICGLYGSKTPEYAMGVFNLGYGWVPLDDDIVLGRVRQWGRVIEYEQGYRSEFAEVIEIVNDGTRKIRGIAQQYDADLVSPPEIRKKAVALWSLLALSFLVAFLFSITLNVVAFLAEPSFLHAFVAILLSCMLYTNAKSDLFVKSWRIFIRRGKKKS